MTTTRATYIVYARPLVMFEFDADVNLFRKECHIDWADSIQADDMRIIGGNWDGVDPNGIEYVRAMHIVDHRANLPDTLVLDAADRWSPPVGMKPRSAEWMRAYWPNIELDPTITNNAQEG